MPYSEFRSATRSEQPRPLFFVGGSLLTLLAGAINVSMLSLFAVPVSHMSGAISRLGMDIDRWIVSGCSTGKLASDFCFDQAGASAAAYERGEEVEVRWQNYLRSLGECFPELTAFVTAAAAEPKLRQLFPFTSLNRFCFSRCTGYPFTHDTPHVVPLGHEQYEVVGPSGKSLGRGSAADAVALAVAALPPDCGPAVPGTADQLSGG